MELYMQALNAMTEVRPHHNYYLVTEGATSKNGGIAHVKKREGYLGLNEKRVALVGDYVQYADGSIATIISGTGCSMLLDDIPLAISNSALDNGDIIEEAGILYKDCELCVYEDEPLPEGFLVKNWTFSKE